MTGNNLKENAMIVVTGATGKLGQPVAEAVKQARSLPRSFRSLSPAGGHWPVMIQ
jgi:uncharacterized protein YbjT (DUF2867 family)